jgi:hypothetical protein
MRFAQATLVLIAAQGVRDLLVIPHFFGYFLGIQEDMQGCP